MIRLLVAAGILGAALAGPLSAQQSPPAEDRPPAPQLQADKAIIGLPVFSSDGQKLGEVTDVEAVSGDQPAIRAEMGEFLGIGSMPVVIAPDAFLKKDDRIELAMTAAEVRDTLARQRQMRDREK
jgi:PRC-barrel domain